MICGGNLGWLVLATAGFTNHALLSNRTLFPCRVTSRVCITDSNSPNPASALGYLFAELLIRKANSYVQRIVGAEEQIMSKDKYSELWCISLAQMDDIVKGTHCPDNVRVLNLMTLKKY